jgi:hypothetical protein
MTSAYIIANQDAGTWTLWEANPTSNPPDLVAVDIYKNNVESSSCSSISSKASVTLSPAPFLSLSSSTVPTLSAGAIASVAAGIAIAVAGLTVLLILLYRRHNAPGNIPGLNYTTSEMSFTPCVLSPPFLSSALHELPGSPVLHKVHAEFRGSRPSELEAKLSPKSPKSSTA